LLDRVLIAALLSMAGSALAAGELRTLFHTAQERERLDRVRRGEPPEAPSAKTNVTPAVTGFVKRSDGQSTVWIDGRRVTGLEADRLLAGLFVGNAARKEARAIEVPPSR
jgi:hypothetical protein